MRFEIRNPKEVKGYSLPTNKKIKNIGTYQLFIYKGDYFKAVNFNYKASFIVYLIYMIDKYKKREDIDPIDMLEKSGRKSISDSSTSSIPIIRMKPRVLTSLFALSLRRIARKRRRNAFVTAMQTSRCAWAAHARNLERFSALIS